MKRRIASFLLIMSLTGCWQSWRDFINQNASDQSAIIADLRILSLKNMPEPGYFFRPEVLMTPARTYLVEEVDWATDVAATNIPIRLETVVAEPRKGDVSASLRWCVQPHINGRYNNRTEVEYLFDDGLSGGEPTLSSREEPEAPRTIDTSYFQYVSEIKPRDANRVASCVALTNERLNELPVALRNKLRERFYEWSFDEDALQTVELVNFQLNNAELDALFSLVEPGLLEDHPLRLLFNGIVLTPVLNVKRDIRGQTESEHAFVDITLRPDWFSDVDDDESFNDWRHRFEDILSGFCDCNDYGQCESIYFPMGTEERPKLVASSQSKEVSGLGVCYAESSWTQDDDSADEFNELEDNVFPEPDVGYEIDKTLIKPPTHPSGVLAYIQVENNALGTSSRDIIDLVQSVQNGGDGLNGFPTEIFSRTRLLEREDRLDMTGRSAVFTSNLGFSSEFGFQSNFVSAPDYFALELETLDGRRTFFIERQENYIDQPTRYYLLSEQFGLFTIDPWFIEENQRQFYSNIDSYAPFVSIEPLFPESELVEEEMTLILVTTAPFGGVDVRFNAIHFEP